MRVSVVIPTFNVQIYIEDAVRSAFASEWPDVEVICVDDGSTDGTREKFEELQQEFPGLRVLLGEHGGASSARNLGLAHATGDYVQFLDADDLLFPAKLGHQAELAETKAAEIIAGAYVVATVGSDHVSTILPMSGDPLLGLMSSGLGITSSNLFRTETVRSIGGWDETKASSQEADLMFRMLAAGAAVALDEQPLTMVRQGRSGSISSENIANNLLTYSLLRRDIIEFVLQEEPHRPEKIQQFVDAYFDVLQRLAKHDLVAASDLYGVIRRTGCRPSQDPGSRPRYMLLLMRAIGFRRAQQFRLLFKSLSQKLLTTKAGMRRDGSSL